MTEEQQAAKSSRLTSQLTENTEPERQQADKQSNQQEDKSTAIQAPGANSQRNNKSTVQSSPQTRTTNQRAHPLWDGTPQADNQQPTGEQPTLPVPQRAKRLTPREPGENKEREKKRRKGRKGTEPK